MTGINSYGNTQPYTNNTKGPKMSTDATDVKHQHLDKRELQEQKAIEEERNKFFSTNVGHFTGNLAHELRVTKNLGDWDKLYSSLRDESSQLNKLTAQYLDVKGDNPGATARRTQIEAQIKKELDTQNISQDSKDTYISTLQRTPDLEGGTIILTDKAPQDTNPIPKTYADNSKKPISGSTEQ